MPESRSLPLEQQRISLFLEVSSTATERISKRGKDEPVLQNEKKVLLFERMPVPKAVLNLAVPTVLSSLVMVIYNLADTYFVGMLNDPIQNAAVALASPVLLAFNAVNNLFGVGSSSMMSRALGRKDMDTVAKSSAFGFYCSVVCGILFSVLCAVFLSPLLQILGAGADTSDATSAYLFWTVLLGAAPSILNVVLAYLVRAEGASLHASIGTMSGFHMGAAGAGLATFLSNSVACLYFFTLLWLKRKTTYVCVHPRRFSLDREIVRGVFGVGVPASIQNLLNVTGMTVLNNFTAAYGANAVAAMGIAQKINMIPMQISMGLSQGIMPLISYNYASGNAQRVKQTLRFAVQIALTFITLVAAGYFWQSKAMIRLFMQTPEIIEYGSAFLRGFCLGLPFLCMDFIAVGVFQAAGLGRNALVFAILRKVVLEIPALFILNALFGVVGLAYAQMTAEIVLAAAAVVVLIRLMKQMEETIAFRQAPQSQEADI